ncbi:TSUP family transporter [Kitasatospora sp. NPDC048365]|uniref:TSUP family transporter n=1 Tax=Kitasatospora sp. NPDC048365 TaxID=3364050 RepID=UPI00371AACAA
MTAVLLALAAGAVVGLALGGLGGGGSMLAVPALIYLLGVGPATAATASLLIVAATALSGLLAHARAGRVRWRTGALFTAAGLPAAALGGTLSGHAPAALLTAAFAALAALAAGRMLAATRKPAAPEPPAAAPGTPAAAPRQLQPVPSGAATRAAAPGLTPLAGPATGTGTGTDTGTAQASASAGTRAAGASGHTGRTVPSDSAPVTARPDRAAPATADVPEPHPASARTGAPAGPGRGRTALTGAGLGLTTGLLGVGGGFLAVPALVSGLALSMAEATGTSLLVITANSLAALVPRLGAAGDVPWAVVGPFAAAAVLGAWDGKRLAAKVSGRTLQRVFASALLAVAALMLADAVL